MLKRMLVVCLIALLLPLASSARPRNAFLLTGAVSLPSGDFGDDRGSEAGLATTGIGVGLDVVMPTSNPGLSFLLSGFVVSNGVDDDLFDEPVFLGQDCNGECLDLYMENVDIGSHLNIPIMAGIRYESWASRSVDLFLQGQVGVTFYRAPSLEWDLVSCDEADDCINEGPEEDEYDTATSFGFGLGGGLILNRNVEIGIRYLDFGTIDLEGEETFFTGETEEFESEQSVAMFLLTVGIRL